MKFEAVEGKNKKFYIKITLETANDYELISVVDTIVSRTEYFPFMKGFNKNITETYLIDETYFPAQFWGDVYKKMKNIFPNLELINSHILYNQTVNKKDFYEWADNLNLPEYIDLYSDKYAYQLGSVYNALLFKTARILIATGGGKTLITYLYCKYIVDHYLGKDKKILVIVPRKMLVTQTMKEFVDFANGENDGITIQSIFAGSKKVENANIVIGTYQSLTDYYEDFFTDFYTTICDELHTAKSNSIKEGIYTKTKSEFYLGMTATMPEYKTLDYLNIVAMFGTNVYTKTTKELIDDGNVCPVFINKVIINYNDLDSQFATNLKLDIDITPNEKYRIEKVFFGEHYERTKLTSKLVNGFENNFIIMLDSISYCERLSLHLRENCPNRIIEIITGATSDKERERIKNLMEERDDIVLIGTSSCIATGVSIKNIHHIIFVEGGKGRTRIMQSTGRGLRLHPKKEFLNIFDFQDMMPNCSFKNHNKARNKIYDNEKHPSKEFIVNLK
jgi:superfamily II DNA or RNA helicase